jgi:hypothetical protein
LLTHGVTDARSRAAACNEQITEVSEALADARREVSTCHAASAEQLQAERAAHSAKLEGGLFRCRVATSSSLTVFWTPQKWQPNSPSSGNFKRS